MTLSKFYQLVSGHAEITLMQGKKVIYHGPLCSIPDAYDEMIVRDFKGTNTGFVFFLK